MKRIAALFMFLCVGLFAAGCDNRQADEAKEKLKKAGESAERAGGELMEAGKEAGGAIKSGTESLIESGKEATKSATDATTTPVEGDNPPATN